MSAALVGGGAVAGAAVGGPVGAAVGAFVGWLVGRGLAPSETPVALKVEAPPRFYVGEKCGDGFTMDGPDGRCVPIDALRYSDVASASDCPQNWTFERFSRQADSRGECRPPAPDCTAPEVATWTLLASRRMGWECRNPGKSYTSGLGFSGPCGPGMTSNPIPAGPQCLPTSESAYTSGGPNRSPFAGLSMVAGPRVSK